ncbi:MAG TPA: transcription elongation factor GreA [Candidatus Paceibacterota bacterium]
MSDDKEYLSQEKFIEFKTELDELATVKRREIADSLEQAKSLGDLRENAEYQEARTTQAALEERIAYLTNVLSHVVVVDSHHSTKVEVGSVVKIKRKGATNTQIIILVGSSEANMSQAKVSHESPIGKAMIGKKKGDIFEVKTSKGLVEYHIVDIE